jgi:GNAT superfamily N-acetyltransferase
MIRNATAKDTTILVRMGRNFRGSTPYAKYISDNPGKATQLISQLIRNKTLIVLEEGEQIVGMLGYIVHSHFMSGDLVVTEVFWWVEPEHRGSGVSLMDEMENRARTLGAKFTQMIAPNAKVARFYRHCGYEFVESCHQKAL